MKVGLTYNIKKVRSHESGVRSQKNAEFNSELRTPNSEHISSLPPDFFAEWDDEDTIEAVRTALAGRHNVVMIEADENAYEKLKSFRPQIVFNIAEGLWGQSRESQIPAMLDMLRIPYTGSGPLSLGICLDKARAKEILMHHGIPTPKFTIYDLRFMNLKIGNRQSKIENLKPLSFPLIVKPLYEGSSKGVRNNSVVNNTAELKERAEWVIAEYKQPALVEEFLEGREFTVAMIGNGNDVKTLPIVEINYSSLPSGVNPIYSYEAKWIWDTPDNPLEIFKCPADIGNKLKKDIETVCKAAFNILDIKDWCRIDIRLDAKENPHILELNPLPGILPDPKSNSCFPKAARAAGMDYDKLINIVLDTACKRHGIAI
ncbi:MAG: ATP-grasp domain-containing protein [Deltaproteobacteria bacterium]|nr:ATP-grasp domain-containing protein [Deltaproteobacteria bacterium]